MTSKQWATGLFLAILFANAAWGAEYQASNNEEFAQYHAQAVDNDSIYVIAPDEYLIWEGSAIGEPRYLLDRDLIVTNLADRDTTYLLARILNSSAVVKGFTTEYFYAVLDGPDTIENPEIQGNLMSGFNPFGGSVSVWFDHGAISTMRLVGNTQYRGAANRFGGSYYLSSLNGADGTVWLDHNKSLEPYTYGNAPHGYVHVGAGSKMMVDWLYDEQIAGSAAINNCDAFIIFNDGEFEGVINHASWTSYNIVRLVSGPNATSSKLVIRNSIIMGKIINEGGWELIIDHSNLPSGIEGEWVDGGGNLSEDPLFEAEWNHGLYDYNLRPGSPCIGTGLETDGTITDMGAYPFHYPDLDQDGVPDNIDQCLETQPGYPVNDVGCADYQYDHDLDGVLDEFDECPDTPTGATVNAVGCEAYQYDTDGDGVMDDVDECPDTPAGVAVNAVGCDPCLGYVPVAETCGVGLCTAFSLTECTNVGGVAEFTGTCAPGEPQIEIRGDGIDQDCDGSDLPAIILTTWYKDLDHDRYSDGQTLEQTEQPQGFIPTSDLLSTTEDCDDADRTIYPGAPEVPNDGIDQDCDHQDLVTEPENSPPEAVARALRTTLTVGESTTLIGSDSFDPDEEPLTYCWEEPDGSVCSTLDTYSPPAFSEVGTYTYRLTVADTHQSEDEDEVIITVTNKASSGSGGGGGGGCFLQSLTH